MNKILFPYKINSEYQLNSSLLNATRISTDFFNSQFHRDQIANFPLKFFEDSKVEPSLLLLELEVISKRLSVVPIIPSWYWKKSVRAWVKESKPTTIYLNSRIIPSEYNEKIIAEITGTIVHETIHVIDNYSKYKFGHYSSESKLSAPYWYGTQARNYARLLLAGAPI